MQPTECLIFIPGFHLSGLLIRIPGCRTFEPLAAALPTMKMILLGHLLNYTAILMLAKVNDRRINDELAPSAFESFCINDWVVTSPLLECMFDTPKT